MINYQTDRSSLIGLGEREHETYVANTPFSHIVIDQFFDPGAMDEVLTEVDAVDRSKRYAKLRIRVSRVFRGLILDLIPPIFRKTVRAIKRAIKGEKLTELWN